MRRWQNIGLLGLAGCGFIGVGEYNARVDADGDGLYPQGFESGDNYDCDDGNKAIGTPTTWYRDSDGDGEGDPASPLIACDPPDGYSAENEDCDDTNNTVFENATELCDGIDNNCNGEIDDGFTFLDYYPDNDGDLQGDGTADPVLACSPPDGYVLDSRDCDDTDALEFAGQSWFPDGDGDGWGLPAGSTECERALPTDVLDNTDCDDQQAAVYPGAPELCDGLTNNCAANANTSELDLDGDGFVACASNAPWIGPGSPGYDDCDDNLDTVNPGAIELCDGLDNNCDNTIPPDEIDTDGDGFVACAPWLGAAVLYLSGNDCEEGDNTSYPGAPAVCGDGVVNDCDVGAQCGAFGALVTPDALSTITGDAPNGLLGTSIASLQGWVSSACPQLALGAPATGGVGSQVFVFGDDASLTGSCRGSWRMSHRNTGPTMPGSTDAPEFVLRGDPVEGVGRALAAVGDFDNGGDNDLLISAPLGPVGGAYLTRRENMQPGPPINLDPVTNASVVTQFSGGLGSLRFGETVASAGQFDAGLGLCTTCTDLWIGDPSFGVGPDVGGAAYLVLGDPNLVGLVNLGALGGVNALIFKGSTVDQRVGSGLDAGDFTGDGVPDLVIGAEGAGSAPGDRDGRIYVIPGPVIPGEFSLDAEIGTALLPGSQLDGRSGSRLGELLLSPELVLNGDGAADLVVGAPGDSSDTGAVFLLTGGALPVGNRIEDAAALILEGTDNGDLFGTHLATGDLDGDGLLDLVVSAPGAPSGFDDGWIYLFSGVQLQNGGVLQAADATGIIKGVGAEAASAVHVVDLDLDGIDDLVVGAAQGAFGVGKVYLFFGDTE